MPRRFAACLVLVPLTGCFVDPGKYGATADVATTGTTAADDAGATTTADPTTTGTTTTTDPNTDPNTDPGTDPTAEPTSASETTAPPPVVCGNGIVEAGEACDDGNLVVDDGCKPDCTSTTCSDGAKNQSETDLDCGGPCQGCGACFACQTDGDCSPGLVCGGGLCVASVTHYIDWAAHCGFSADFFPFGPELPPGTYRITAIGGAGSTFDDPPEWMWYAQCVGLDLEEMSSFGAYETPEAAFQSLKVKEVVREYAGGALRCGFLDEFCGDNLGGVTLGFELLCN